MLTAIVLGGLAAIVGAALWWARAQPVQGAADATIFCPRHETVVRVVGDRCMAVDGDGCVGSIWDCQRECMPQAPAQAP